jgi:hypothetical protein
MIDAAAADPIHRPGPLVSSPMDREAMDPDRPSDRLSIDIYQPDGLWIRRPVVRFLVNGIDLAEVTRHPGFFGLDPVELLNDAAPLLARRPRRVVLYRCSCGDVDCGNLTPLVKRRRDGRIGWTDFRSYVGGSVMGSWLDQDPLSGTPVKIPDLIFDLEVYKEEVRRASRPWVRGPRLLIAD